MIKCNYPNHCSADSQQPSCLIPQQSLHLIRALSVIHKIHIIYCLSSELEAAYHFLCAPPQPIAAARPDGGERNAQGCGVASGCWFRISSSSFLLVSVICGGMKLIWEQCPLGLNQLFQSINAAQCPNPSLARHGGRKSNPWALLSWQRQGLGGLL